MSQNTKKSHNYNQTASKTKTIYKNKIQYATSTTECLKNADCYILVTEWAKFKKLKPENFIKNMRRPILIDGRRIYDPKQFNLLAPFFGWLDRNSIKTFISWQPLYNDAQFYWKK